MSTSRATAASRPRILTVAGIVIIAAMCLAPCYLVLRAIQAGPDAYRLLWSARTARVLWNSALLVTTVTTASVVIGVALAWLTARTDLPGRRAWLVAASLPLAIPSYVGGFALLSSLGPRGMLLRLLQSPLGLERLPDIHGFGGAFYLLTVLSYPYVLLSTRAGLLTMDPSLEEAARSAGSDAREAFLSVTLPLLRPAIAAGALLVALYTLSDFGGVSLLGYETFTWAIYSQYQGSFDRSSAALLAVCLLVITIVVLWLDSRITLRRSHRRGQAVKHQPMRPLGRWRWPALGFCAAAVAAGLAGPLLVITYWLTRGLRHGETVAFFGSAAWHSMLASGLSALATAAAALPVAYLTVRYRGRFAAAVRSATYLGYGLPGIVLGLALVFFGSRVPFLYQSMTLLVFAYLVHFVPQAAGASSAALRETSPRAEEAARSLGAGPTRVFRTVTYPSLHPGILSGMALVFLTTMKELPLTLLLAPTGFETLATRVWSATSEAFFARAAAPAMTLMALSALSLTLLLRAEPREP